MTALHQCLANISPLYWRSWWLSLWVSKFTNFFGVVNTTTHKNELRRRAINATTLALGGFVALAFAGPSIAQTANAGDVWNWMAYQTNGNTVSVVPTTSSANAVRDMGWKGTATSSADIGWTGRPSMRNGAGNMFAVDVIAKTPATKAAKLLTAGAKALPVIGTGVMLWELCNELQFGCSKSATGEPQITKSDPAACTTSPCYYYKVYTYNGLQLDDVFTSLVTAKSFWEQRIQKANANAGNPAVVFTWTQSGENWIACENGGCAYAGGVSRIGTRPPDTSSAVPATIQDLEDAIASKSGWPSGSKIHDALKESAQATGQKIPFENSTVSGPATSKGTSKTTNDPAKGTTTTTTTTYGHTYQDNRVTNNITTSVNVTNNTTGATETSTTTEDTVEEPTECEKNPKAWGCSDLDTPDDEVPKKEKQLTFDPENIGLGNGSCPALIPFHTSKGDWVLNLGPYCDATVNYVRPVVILFGLLAAFFIAVPGGVKL